MKQKKLSYSYLSTLCMELSMLLTAGISIYDGVLMLKEDEPDKDGKKIMQNLLNALENGVFLSTALKEAYYFPDYMVNMIKIGEETGRLTETLEGLSKHYERQERLKSSIINAVSYPAILLALMVVVVLILIVRVLPIFNDVSNRLGHQMSPMALWLMKLGRWIEDVSVIIATISGIIFVIIFLVLATPQIRNGIVSAVRDRLGNYGILGKIAISRFTSTMALAISSGLDTEKAIELAVLVSGGSKAIDEKHDQCMELMRSGTSLSEALCKVGILSARNSRLFSIGCRSGTADVAMTEIAHKCECNVYEAIERIIGKIEPMIVIIISVIIGVILMSVMLPIMGIMTTIG